MGEVKESSVSKPLVIYFGEWISKLNEITDSIFQVFAFD